MKSPVLLACGGLSLASFAASYEVPTDFWTETSRVTFRTNANGAVVLDIGDGGYAVSDFIPKDDKIDYQVGIRRPELIWYDGDFNLMSAACGEEGRAFCRIYLHTFNNRCGRFCLAYDPHEAVRKAREDRDFDREIEIVLAERHPTLELVAREVARHAKLVTGRDYAIVAKPTGRPRRIRIGRDLAASGDDVVITGKKTCDILYAACRFVEEEMGVIWVRPDPKMGTVFTHRDRLEFKGGVRTFKSVCDRRTWGGPGGLDYTDTDLWWARNGANNTICVRDGRFGPGLWWGKTLGKGIVTGGSCMDYIRPHLAAHPDLAAIVDGLRPSRKRSQMCFTHPDGPRLFAESARKFLENAPDGVTDDLQAVLEDSWSCCECERCMKGFPANGSKWEKSRFRSTQYFSFLNRALAEVRKFRPNATLTAHAYIFAAVPPACEISDGVYAEFCPYPEVNLRFPVADSKSDRWADDWREWLTRHGRWTVIREYYFTSAFAMFAEPFAANLRELVKHGGHAFYSQTQPDTSVRKSFEGEGVPANLWDANPMDQWLINRLLQMPDADVAKLRDYYLRRAYPTAHAEVAEFYRLFAVKWFDPSYPGFVNCHTRWGTIFREFIEKAGIEEKCRGLLVKAVAKERNANAKAQLVRMLAAFDEQAATLGRASIASVPEIVPEWRDADSMHWLKATPVTNFRRIYTQDPVRGLEVRLGYDGTNLYYRTSGGGLFSLHTRSGERGRRDHALGETGIIPLAALMHGDGIELLLMHRSADGVESYAGTETKVGIGWPLRDPNKFTPYSLEERPKPGIAALPENALPREKAIETGDLYGAIEGFPHPVTGARWVNWEGRRLVDTSYGSISTPIPVSDAKDYVLTVAGHHYGGYLAIYIRFLDERGGVIKMIQEKKITEAGTDVLFRPPKGCTAMTVAPYNLILSKLELKEAK